MEKAKAEKLFKDADDLYQGGNYAAALDVLDRLDAEFPESHRILYPRAMCLVEIGRYPEALALCDRLIRKHAHRRAVDLKLQIQQERMAMGVATPTAPGELAPLEIELIQIEESPIGFAAPRIAHSAPAADRRGTLALVIAFVVVTAATVASGYLIFM